MNWKKGPIIGCGSSATVSVATTVAGDIFAVKSMELSSSLMLQKEHQFLSNLRSRYIIEYIGFDIDYDHHVPMYNLFMEYASGGSISDVIKNHGGFLDECLIRSYVHQILLGLDYLHSNNLVHCDIKCDNILMCEDGIKIGDLGCAKLLEKDGDATSAFSGTPVFMAPEVARGEKQGFEADVWAVGCVVIEMATGSNPWPEIKDPVSGLYKIGYSGDVPLFPACLSEEAQDFLNKCLQRNDKERWTVKQLLQHPFISSNLISKTIGNRPKSSPSSILDQGFWDSLEITDSRSPIKNMNFSGEAPVDRIKQLVEATSLGGSCLPNWVDEEDWITVRNNNVDDFTRVADMEDVDTESTRSESESLSSFSELYVEEGFSISVRIVILESNVLETSGASVVSSRFLNFKNIIDDNWLLFDSNMNFALFALHIQVICLVMK